MPGDYFCSSFSVLLLLVMVEKMFEVVPLTWALTSWANEGAESPGKRHTYSGEKVSQKNKTKQTKKHLLKTDKP